MKTNAARTKKRDPHSHSHRAKPAHKEIVHRKFISGEDAFLPEPRTAGVDPSREKAAPEFLRQSE
jgi:hypothetical protein